MGKLIKALLRIIVWPLKNELAREIKHHEKNIKCAPNCCGEPMEHIGEHSGFYLNTQFYQCQKCKRLVILHNRE